MSECVSIIVASIVAHLNRLLIGRASANFLPTSCYTSLSCQAQDGATVCTTWAAQSLLSHETHEKMKCKLAERCVSCSML